MDEAFHSVSEYILSLHAPPTPGTLLPLATLFPDAPEDGIDNFIRALAKDMACQIKDSDRTVPWLLRHIVLFGSDKDILQVAFFEGQRDESRFLGKSALIGGYSASHFEYHFFYEIGHIRILVALNKQNESEPLELVVPERRSFLVHADSQVPFNQNLATRADSLREALGADEQWPPAQQAVAADRPAQAKFDAG